MVQYNLTLLDNTTSLKAAFDTVNTASNQGFSIMLLLVLFIIMFISIKLFYDTKVAFLTSASSISLISVLLLIIGYITWEITLICIVLMMFAFIAYFFSKE